MALFWWGYFTVGKKRLGIKIDKNIELVSAYRVYYFVIPFFFKKMIVGYDFSKNQYYEIDERLEDRLLKLGKNPKSNEVVSVVDTFEKQRTKEVELYGEEQDEENFGRFIKIMGIVLGVILLLILLKWLFFKT